MFDHKTKKRLTVFHVGPSARPDPPLDVTLSDVKDDTLTLSWIPGRSHNSPITGNMHTPSNVHSSHVTRPAQHVSRVHCGSEGGAAFTEARWRHLEVGGTQTGARRLQPPAAQPPPFLHLRFPRRCRQPARPQRAQPAHPSTQNTPSR